jgi:anti-sigma-K factor RskA
MNGGHPTHAEDFDLYALGALEGEEKQAIQAHVAACPECAGKLAEARGRVSMLAFAAPVAPPSPAMKQRLMAQIHAESGAAPASTPAQAWKPVVDRLPEEPRPSVFNVWWAKILIPAGAALAVASIFLWNENRQLDRQLASLRTTLDQQQRQLQDSRDINALLAAKDSVSIALAQQPGQPAGAARVVYNQQTGLLMYDGTLTPAPVDKSYELWLVPAQGDPINAGVFTPVNGQVDHWLAKMPPGTAARAFAVTMEPVGGTAQPTGPKVLVGPIS